MGWYETCVWEVSRMVPPGKMCDYNRCLRIQKKIDSACHNRGWTPGSPYVLDNPDGTECYCCCSCFAWDVPIAIGPTDTKPIQNFVASDPVYAAVFKNGAITEWKLFKVETSTGLAPSQGSEPFIYRISYGPNAQAAEEIWVTEDHLFLQPGGTLIPANALKPGDPLIQQDGGTVPVRSVVSGSTATGVHHIATGPFVNNDLSGHLLSANRIVCADLAVQVGYITGQLDARLLAGDLDNRLRAGTAEYRARHLDDDAVSFINDPARWPRGFTPATDDTLVNVPARAHRFITDKQAEDIQNSDAQRRDVASGYGLTLVDHVIASFQPFYPDIEYLRDWGNPVPNAYAWKAFGKKYAVITGGFSRLAVLGHEGLALILAHLIATLEDGGPADYPPGNCVGPADYRAITNMLGRVYWEASYLQVAHAGISQLERLFEIIPEEDRRGNPDDKCNDPGTTCRISAYRAALALDDLPACAQPRTKDFEVTGAVATPKSVTVSFSEPVDPASAETPANYTLVPAIVVTGARVDPDDIMKVKLDVRIKPDIEYILTVENVLNHQSEELAFEKNRAVFTLTRC